MVGWLSCTYLLFFSFSHTPHTFDLLPVHKVFENVADKYDLMNDLMSGFIHRAWKDHFVSHLRPRGNAKLLDVAGGTGSQCLGCVAALVHEELRD